MKIQSTAIAGVLLSPLVFGTGCSDDAHLSYAGDVAPILEARCAECHLPGGEGATRSGFIVGSYETVMAGTRYGAVVIPGSSTSSSLYRLLSGKVDPSIRMPHQQEPLSDSQIETIKLWIDQGAHET